MLSWETFDWQSLATLLTGSVAVVGATWVGVRQAGITRRQADIARAQNAILANQVEIEALKLKADLFDRRFQVYDATVNYLINPFGRGNEQRVMFFDKVREGRFLLSSGVYSALQEIADRTDSLRLLDERLKADSMAGRVSKPADLEKHGKLREWLWDSRANIADIFAPDLHLGLHNLAVDVDRDHTAGET